VSVNIDRLYSFTKLVERPGKSGVAVHSAWAEIPNSAAYKLCPQTIEYTCRVSSTSAQQGFEKVDTAWMHRWTFDRFYKSSRARCVINQTTFHCHQSQ